MSAVDWMWMGVLVGLVPLLCLGAMLQRGVQCLYPTRTPRAPQQPPEPAYLASERTDYPPPPQIVVMPVVLPPSQVQYLPYPYAQQLQPRVIDALPAIEGSWGDGTSQGQW